MVDVIAYKLSHYGLVFIHDKPLGLIIYHIKHERVYVSYKLHSFLCFALMNLIETKQYIFIIKMYLATFLYLMHQLYGKKEELPS